MDILSDFDLKKHNSFGIQAFAKKYVRITNGTELIEVLKNHKSEKKFILGGGSNMLLTQNIDALVIYIDIKGISVVSETENDLEMN